MLDAIKGTDITNTSIVDGYLYWDSDSNPTGSSVLTTSYVNFVVSQSPGDKIQHSIYLFINVPWSPGGAVYNQEDWSFSLDVGDAVGRLRNKITASGSHVEAV